MFFGSQREFARRIYVSPLGAGPRAREGAVLYAIDATEQKALELKFAQSHKMEAVGKLAGGVAHDFNNVLTAIIGFSDLLLQTHRPTDPAYRDIMNIKSSANRAAGLVRQLLAFSRRQTLQAGGAGAGRAADRPLRPPQRRLGEKIELKILPGRDLWHVKADRTQFEHVIINLAVNAGTPCPTAAASRSARATCRERESLKLAGLGIAAGEYVLIEVEDTGVGMPPEVIGQDLRAVLHHQGGRQGHRPRPLHGLRHRQADRRLHLRRQRGRQGHHFPRLPAAPHRRERGRDRRSAPEKAEVTRDLTGSGRVLLVEDEDVVRSFAARALARQGYEVLEAGTGVEALEVVEREQRRIDIVVSDVIMPEMDGPTLLKELRKTNPDLKFIFVSGYPDDAFKKSLDEDEDYAFLPKPFTLPQLAAKVKEQLTE